jgi:predicted enzyme related to lactoylglutathione lyase
MTVHAKTFAPPRQAAVWFEIPTADMDRAKKFYSSVLATQFSDENGGPNPMAVFAYSGDADAVSGHLYPGKPAPEGSGPTVHFPLPDSLEAGMQRVWDAGGKVVSPVIEIPAGRFAYCRDLDGNSFGLFTR